jgi:hypothetical protein
MAYSYQVVADDPDDGPGPLAYSLDTAPTGMTIGSTSGLVQWTPTAGQVAGSPHAVTVRVTDGAAPVTQSYAVTVTDGGGGTPWWNTAWTARSRLTFDMTGLTTDLVDLPVLVVLTSSRINYGVTQAGGADLRFLTDDQTTVLPHEVEQWTAGGTSYVWVRVPLIAASGGPAAIWLYYGNAAAPDGQNVAAVWTGHRAVWHLASMTDATGQGHTGVNQGTIDAAGKIGRARRFGGARIQVAHAATLSFTAADSFTLSAWVNVESLPSLWKGIVTKSRDAAPWYGIWISSSNKWVAGGPINAPTIPAAIGWSHVTVVQNGPANQRHIYINGLLGNTKVAQDANGIGNLVIGGSNGAAEDFVGLIDEVRLSATPASPDWIAALVRSENDTFVTFTSVP